MAPAVEDVVLADSRSPFKGKKGIPVWYKGKISLRLNGTYSGLVPHG